MEGEQNYRVTMAFCHSISSTDLQSFPSHPAERFFGLILGSSPGLWAATTASYCPSRAGELPKNNPKNLSA